MQNLRKVLCCHDYNNKKAGGWVYHLVSERFAKWYLKGIHNKLKFTNIGDTAFDTSGRGSLTSKSNEVI